MWHHKTWRDIFKKVAGQEEVVKMDVKLSCCTQTLCSSNVMKK
jgi:hypothetical protein